MDDTAGHRTNHHLMADIDGNGRADHVRGWSVINGTVSLHGQYTNASSTLGTEYTMATSTGSTGKTYRAGDVNGDGKFDLVYGHFNDEDTVSWLVMTGTGVGLNGAALWNTGTLDGSMEVNLCVP